MSTAKTYSHKTHTSDSNKRDIGYYPFLYSKSDSFARRFFIIYCLPEKLYVILTNQKTQSVVKIEHVTD